MITAISISSVAAFAFATVDFQDDNRLKSSAAMLGHITLIAYDENGNVKDYVQTDNVILNEGDLCIVEDLFGAASSCGDGSALFDDIALGTGTVTFTEGSSLSQLTWHSTTAAGTPSAATTPSGASGSSTTVTANFFDVGATITEAALHNNPTSASADTIAIQDFGDIVLGASDDLTVQ